MKVAQAPVLDEVTHAALASGRIEPSLGLFIDCLLTMRGLSEAAGDALAGAALESEAPVPMHDDALAMAFAAIDRGGPVTSGKRSLRYPELGGLPPVLVEAILAAEAKGSWRTAGPGIQRLDLGLPVLNKPGAGKAEMIRLEAGKAAPRHTHKGRELTLCVHGEYSDGISTYGPGDFSVIDGETRHQPVAREGSPAYALAVLDAGLRFEGLLGALQRLFSR